jgi:methionyl-tRNA formyltransferase
VAGPPAATVFLGSGAFAVPILDALAASPAVRLAGVVTTPARPAGRDRTLRPTPVAVRSAELGIPVLNPDRLRDPDAVGAIAALRPELLVLADYGRIVPQDVLDLPIHGALNLHPSLLPRHRGATPIPGAILAGDAETGVTLIRMDAGVDTGPIVAQRRRSLAGDEVAPDLEARLAGDAAELLTDSLPAWLDGELPAVAQPATGATLTRMLSRDDGRLDPARPAAELARVVRAYQPWPGAWIDDARGRLLVHAAHALPAAPDDRDAAVVPGRLVDVGEDIALATVDGRLILDEVRPAGGRPMTGRAWRRGRRDR